MSWKLSKLKLKIDKVKRSPTGLRKVSHKIEEKFDKWGQGDYKEYLL